MKIFIIDPGHGGTDPGAVGNNLQEKGLTLDISRRIATVLQEQYSDIKPLLTRDTDKSMTLSQRTSWANKQGAAGLLSVHINSAANPDANGFETFIHSSDGADSKSFALQNAIHARTAKLWTGKNRKDRGKKKANLHMVREFKGAAVLIELGFIVNKVDAGLLSDDDFKQSNAQAIAEGIAGYLNLSKKPDPSKKAVLRVTVDGKQIGAYSNPDNAINQASEAVKAGKRSVTIERGN